MKPNKPIIIKIGEQGANVNLNNCVSIGNIKNMHHQRVKEGWLPTAESPRPGLDDLDNYTADTIIFYFIGGSELAFKVGEDIDEDEYNRVQSLIEGIIYDERKPVSNPPAKGAE